MKNKILLVIGMVLVLSLLFIPNVSFASDTSLSDDINSINWSDPEVIKELYENIKGSGNPDKAFAELPLEAQKALMNAFNQEIKYKVKVTQDSGRGCLDLTISVP